MLQLAAGCLSFRKLNSTSQPNHPPPHLPPPHTRKLKVVTIAQPCGYIYLVYILNMPQNVSFHILTLYLSQGGPLAGPPYMGPTGPHPLLSEIMDSPSL